MHIEIGIIDPARVSAANIAAAGVMASQSRHLLNPATVAKTLMAGMAFSVLMQIWHAPVGPSELHIIGATSIYLVFGLAASLLGFGVGLFLQAILFEPQDLAHWGVNSLSLMAPLVAMHAIAGRRLKDAVAERLTLARVFRLDAIYYAGVISMVGFWLSISNDPAPLADWLRWAAYYLPVFAAEAVLTFCVASLLWKRRQRAAIARFTDIAQLRLA